ncbi:MAG: CBS domain-containing protein [Nitrospirae bacterium]|nr:CBS domain-containing protein [Nitrospirota bacterium]
MSSSPSPSQSKETTLDHDIDRVRTQLSNLRDFIMGNPHDGSIEEFDLTTEELISEVFGSASPMLDAYHYAQFGEAGGLVNLTEEAPESANLDHNRQSLRQRQRVLESCVGDLEARRADAAKKHSPKAKGGPRVIEYMSTKIQAISFDATLQEAGKRLYQQKIGSLLVKNGDDFIGSITETELTREVIAQGLDAHTTTVTTCMREPLLTIESSDLIVDVVQVMKEKATRHVAVTESGKIIGVISVSDVLRYYSGIK